MGLNLPPHCCAVSVCQVFRAAAGVKLAVVSNFDTRLRPLLEQLHLAHLFDALVISAEVRCRQLVTADLQ